MLECPQLEVSWLGTHSIVTMFGYVERLLYKSVQAGFFSCICMKARCIDFLFSSNECSSSVRACCMAALICFPCLWSSACEFKILRPVPRHTRTMRNHRFDPWKILEMNPCADNHPVSRVYWNLVSILLEFKFRELGRPVKKVAAPIQSIDVNGSCLPIPQNTIQCCRTFVWWNTDSV